ncbi:type II toxin-antitoxin system RelE/ParE family toxin [Macrococcus carouselicus]|uniref:Type II toxin-antitoxin system RelE/ParE family toxin n=1 Tax=Macrococcus carouselicus TaxID=69969 RepID=A0A9Q8CJ63_9STAP|nr:type II toxin-antitoxin system RelE/ParE family toxin [Macrococcus carouselicus]TDL95536.1 type II toxin-antitoxin system RelE/ParE family toxin [Macrococcus carouselicus]
MANNKWKIDIYRKENGEEPVRNFLDSLPNKERAKVLRTFQLLEEFGTSLGMPHRRHIDEDIYELRTVLGNNIFRVFHFHYKEGTFILLNGFRKKTNKTPTKEIERAKRYRDDYLKQKGEGKV